MLRRRSPKLSGFIWMESKRRRKQSHEYAAIMFAAALAGSLRGCKIKKFPVDVK